MSESAAENDGVDFGTEGGGLYCEGYVDFGGDGDSSALHT